MLRRSARWPRRDDGLSSRRRRARYPTGLSFFGDRLGRRGSNPRTCSPRATHKWARTSRCFCTPRPKKNTRWPAPSVRAVMAITALRCTPIPRSPSRRIWPGGTSRSTPWPQEARRRHHRPLWGPGRPRQPRPCGTSPRTLCRRSLLRVLRVARFAARYRSPSLLPIAPETLDLNAHPLTASGELAHLCQRSACGSRPSGHWLSAIPQSYFEVLQGLPRTGPAVASRARQSPRASIGFDTVAALHTHSSPMPLGDHCCRNYPLSVLSTAPPRIKAPNHYRDLADRVCTWRPRTKAALADPTGCLELLRGLDALRRDALFQDFLEALAALEGTTANVHSSCQQLRSACIAAQSVKASDYADTGLTGPGLGDAIRVGQISAIGAVLGR